ncbi:hypothetical protein ODS41_13440 [Pyrobaculum sp. 3827-6]|uniref:hypothetical protein n=1 Tax=Pyrobaculum sp. 3827-6 TaxID=2983604 RepID=UPI0021D87459|nr:hypothetical protein [Pyrobaculum sp. 3827-6]MCU7788915.1 hypothetical protein [Pyrobaculum sp. 3827-6]
MSYQRVAEGVVGGVSVYVWRRGDSLYATLYYGGRKKTVYLGRWEPREAARQEGDCVEKLKAVLREVACLVELARKAKASVRDPLAAEALGEWAYPPRAVRDALEEFEVTCGEV